MIAASVSIGVSTMAAVVMLGPGGAALASPTNPTAAALGFNVFVDENADLTSNEIEGPLALGGNLRIGGPFQVAGSSPGTFIAPGDGTHPSALVIGGAINWLTSAPGAILAVNNNNAYAKLGDVTGSQVLNVDSNNAPGNTHIVPVNTPYEGTPRVELRLTQPVTSVLQSVIDFAAAFTDFRNSSTALAGCTNNVILTNANGVPLSRPIAPLTQAYITLAPNTTNVLNLTGVELDNLVSLTFNNSPTATQPLLVNVDTSADNTYVFDVPNQAGIGIGQAPFILWNFPTASSITMPSTAATLEGTLYAPNADLIDLSPNNIEGQVITESITMGGPNANGGEVHYAPFTATLNCVATSPTPSVSPSTSVSPSPSASPSTSPSPSASPSTSPSPSASPSTSPSPSMSPSRSPSASPTVRPSRSPYGRPYPPRP
ncbi:choice-of-anchor A family protein [Catellatospora sp. KI3]|uniref:choice-of-anchor A family protein n=1 Tax=Catellatospora sp. KI3 TaxID=3041620 RepID=UPI0024823015|nr:choice-of-anchor A family protein [Catellatospora sp. KI3]MDI1463070.1 choice-of-anchor A family protein [Catellatospora sp. KI3]